MATPQELVAADDARKAKAKAVEVAKQAAARGPANDNAPRAPDGYIDFGDGERMPYWLGPSLVAAAGKHKVSA